jgi:DUF1009 family protein
MGLIAGWGRYPVVIAEALKRQGFAVCCVGVRDHADSQLSQLCDHFIVSGVAQLGQHIRFFRRHGVSQATMAGKIHKARVLFSRWSWLQNIPDLTTLRTFLPHFIFGTQDRKDDTLLLAVVNTFARG